VWKQSAVRPGSRRSQWAESAPRTPFSFGHFRLRNISQALVFRVKMVSPIGGQQGPASGLGAAGKYAGLGLQFVLSILLFLYLGRWVDRKLGTDGPFLLLGVFTGAGAAFYSMYRSLMAEQRREEAEKAAKAAQAGQDSKAGGA
jgi:F0F1-type ATP synthase assembly protein I